jgi:hypothetical protein
VNNRLAFYVGWFVSLVLLPLLALFGCKQTLPPEPDYVVFPPWQGDAGDAGFDAELDVPADCRLACESMAKVGCPESTPAGRTCGSVCAAAERAGFGLKPFCIAAASTPDQIRACGTVECRGR